MNCRNFENVIDELARGSLMEASTRDDALKHTEGCARCATRLSDERTLTAGLHALASQAEAFEAPARVEAALLAAFRERRAATAQAPSVSSATKSAPAFVSDACVWWMPRWAQGAAAAAAAVLVVVGLYGVYRNQIGGASGEQANNVETRASSAATRLEEKPQVDTGVKSDAVAAEGDDNVESSDEALTPRTIDRTHGSKANYRLANYNPRSRRPTTSDAVINSASTTEEIVTDYIPLMNGGQLTPGDAGHVVRVEMPRSALASFGLPVNADRTESRVKADVLMGGDGIARAIRFVR